MKQILLILLAFTAISINTIAQSLVGALGGQFDVNSMGAATYSIPIEVPVGINGMQPTISLDYNSQAGNGVCGVGFSISGLSSISRVPRTIYYDGTAKGIQYNSTDVYELDGKRLLLQTGTEGAEGAVYNLENDPLIKITLKGSGSSQWFEVVYAGVTRRYGKMTNSKQRPNSSRNSIWYLDRTEDIYGNWMEYNYSCTNYSNYVASIVYGKNSSDGVGNTNVVLFNYETRPDVELFIVDGNVGKMEKRLQSISLIRNGKSNEAYVLSYSNTDAYSRLTKVTQRVGGADICTNSFDWSTIPSVDYSPTTASGLSFSSSTTYITSDYDGNGKEDIVSIVGNDIKICELIDGLTTPSFQTVASYRVAGSVIKSKSTTADIHGNGESSVINPTYSNSTKQDSLVFYSYSKSKGLVALPVKTNSSSCSPVYTFADFNNDGKDEGVLIETYKTSSSSQSYSIKLFGINASGKYELYANYSTVFESTPSEIIASDFNNDGLTDILVLHNAGYKIFTNTGKGLSNGTFTLAYSGTDIKGTDDLKTGDFNGDGNIDFVSIGSTTNTFLNNGDFTFTKTASYAISISPLGGEKILLKNNSKYEGRVLDFNHDGIDDIVVTLHDYSDKVKEFSKSYSYWLASDGNTLVSVRENATQDSYSYESISLVGDFDGDGTNDILAYDDIIYPSSRKNKGWHLYTQYGYAASTGKIVVINGDYLNMTKIEYALLTDNAIYSKGTKRTYPLVSMQAAYPVVKNVVSSAAGNNQTTSFAYQDLCAHLQGRGVIGFMKTTSTNSTLGVTNTTEVEALDTKLYIPQKIKTTSKVGSSISSEETSFGITYGTQHRYIISKVVSTLTDMYNNVTKTTETRDVTYGYMLDSFTSDDGGKMTKSVSYGNYALVGGVYKPQKIISTSKHSDDNTSFSTTTTYSYDAKTGELKSEVDFSNLTNKITRTYSYDKYGNMLTSSMSGVGVSSLTETFEYETTKRFVKQKKNSATGQVISYSYDDYGRVLSEVNLTSTSSPLSNVYTYDKCGNVLTCKTPEGIVTSYTYGWGTTPDKRYYISAKTEGSAASKVWYDELGRVVLSESVGELGLLKKVSVEYNAKGLMTKRITTTGAIEMTESYTYDALGRVVSRTSTSGQSETYTYGNRTLATTSGGRTSTQTMDAWGNIKSITDPLGTITTYKYYSNGNANTITSGGLTTTIVYDTYGRRYLVKDPNAEKPTYYTYDGFGRLTEVKDAKGVIAKYTYDSAGRLTTIDQGGQKTSYTYGTASQFLLTLSISNANSTIKYSYDKYKRPTSKTVITGSETMKTSYTYNAYGQISSVSYPNASISDITYDDYGYIKQMKLDGASIWELKTSTGAQRTVARDAKIQTITTLNAKGLLSSQQLMVNGVVSNSLMYAFDGGTGNLTSRTGMTGGTENFTYDKMDRLTEVKNGTTLAMAMSYAANGNITSKTGIGKYTYSTSKPHAVSEVENTGNIVSHETQTVSFTPFNKVSTLTEMVNGKEHKLVITYGPDNQRCKTVLSVAGVVSETHYYADGFERVVKGSTKTDILYVSTPDGLTYIKSGTNGYQVMTDHLGSIVRMYDSTGAQKYSATYDVWGKQTVSTTIAGLRRGFGGHEHWNEFGLIDMNGRMYDPTLGRFLSPDIIVQNPKNSQSFNRYSYCLNNPLKYTDPSGYICDQINEEPEIHVDLAEVECRAKGHGPGSMSLAFGYSMYSLSFGRGYINTSGSYGYGEERRYGSKYGYKCGGASYRRSSGKGVGRTHSTSVSKQKRNSRRFDFSSFAVGLGGFFIAGADELEQKLINIDGLSDKALKRAIAENAHRTTMNKVALFGKIGGGIIAFGSVAMSAIDLLGNENATGADWARIGGGLLIAASGFIPVVGIFVSIGLGYADAYGCFDWFYNKFE